jgi:hypothetical protein
MSIKVESLLKKATTYERLCLYGNRKAFLAAIAKSDNDTAAIDNVKNIQEPTK